MPRFEFDEQRTYFVATLPAHPEYAALSALRDAAHLRTLGEEAEALRRVESAWSANPASAILATEVIRSLALDGKLEQAERTLATRRIASAARLGMAGDGAYAQLAASAYSGGGGSLSQSNRSAAK